ncbi:hypothetical protein EDD16DRAFT_1526505 [Pisolithus croceorrhizus]|nr:hypothetical protein EDD16DRAFT_1526505 [Pisolithus croceorrhizus]KAI6106975.1 hypothetical protein EV401DRAFT_1892266 [Pisolithus croceorrhizus]
MTVVHASLGQNRRPPGRFSGCHPYSGQCYVGDIVNAADTSFGKDHHYQIGNGFLHGNLSAAHDECLIKQSKEELLEDRDEDIPHLPGRWNMYKPLWFITTPGALWTRFAAINRGTYDPMHVALPLQTSHISQTRSGSLTRDHKTRIVFPRNFFICVVHRRSIFFTSTNIWNSTVQPSTAIVPRGENSIQGFWVCPDVVTCAILCTRNDDLARKDFADGCHVEGIYRTSNSLRLEGPECDSPMIRDSLPRNCED